METIHTISKTSPHRVRRQLLRNPELPVESVGKIDMDTLSDVADAPEGRGTVVRLIMGATSTMPLRALTYTDAVLRVARALPCEQVQIIHANRLGERVNGTDVEASHRGALQLAMLSRLHAAAFFPDVLPKLLHAQDQPMSLEDFLPAAKQVFEDNDSISSTLSRKGSKHSGDALVYTAAHSAFQDTDRLRLEALLSDSPKQIDAARIVSVGCQQERIFYMTRMVMREYLDIDLVDTAQVFTTHATPPYFVARGGEQLLDDALLNGVDIEQCHDASAYRDMTQFMRAIGAHHE